MGRREHTVLPPMARATLEPMPTQQRDTIIPAYVVARADPMLLATEIRVNSWDDGVSYHKCPSKHMQTTRSERRNKSLIRHRASLQDKLAVGHRCSQKG